MLGLRCMLPPAGESVVLVESSWALFALIQFCILKTASRGRNMQPLLKYRLFSTFNIGSADMLVCLQLCVEFSYIFPSPSSTLSTWCRRRP